MNNNKNNRKNDNKLQEQKVTKDYLSYFNDVDSKLRNDLSSDEWFHLYSDLIDWQIKFDKYKAPKL